MEQYYTHVEIKNNVNLNIVKEKLEELTSSEISSTNVNGITVLCTTIMDSKVNELFSMLAVYGISCHVGTEKKSFNIERIAFKIDSITNKDSVELLYKTFPNLEKCCDFGREISFIVECKTDAEYALINALSESNRITLLV